MFNNSNFALQYNTMSNEEIMDLDVGSLSKRGFIFLWTINSQFQFAFECLNRWGYNYVDRVCIFFLRYWMALLNQNDRLFGSRRQSTTTCISVKASIFYTLLRFVWLVWRKTLWRVHSWSLFLKSITTLFSPRRGRNLKNQNNCTILSRECFPAREK